MTACTVQSVELHRASVDNLHQVVDSNVKVNLHGMLALYPPDSISQQIKSGRIRGYDKVI